MKLICVNNVPYTFSGYLGRRSRVSISRRRSGVIFKIGVGSCCNDEVYHSVQHLIPSSFSCAQDHLANINEFYRMYSVIKSCWTLDLHCLFIQLPPLMIFYHYGPRWVAEQYVWKTKYLLVIMYETIERNHRQWENEDFPGTEETVKRCLYWTLV